VVDTARLSRMRGRGTADPDPPVTPASPSVLGERGTQGTAEDLRLVLTHLDARAPTLIVQELHAKLIDIQAQGT
jgi:hypothetical protein